MKVSHSRVESFEKCPKQYEYRYLERLKTLPDDDPQNALYLGSALHEGLEKGVEAALKNYRSNFFGFTDLHVHEEMKLSHYVKMGLEQLPQGDHEVQLMTDDFVGYVDLIEHNEDGSVTIWDFKYSSPKSVERYKESRQLPLYAYFYEKLKGVEVSALKYALFPKVMIRQKKTETLEQFRQRLTETLQKQEILIFDVEYDKNKVIEHFEIAQTMLTATEFPKNITRLCDWCNFKQLCLEGNDLMVLPSIERRKIEGADNKKVWIYGAPFTGKTTLANEFDTPLMLNTDGNVKFVDAPFIHIKNQVTVEGRITKTKLAWDLFKETISDLEKGSDFKTVVVDLVEDLHEACRLWMYDKKGWEHESDDSFRAWDMIRLEFLSTMKRLVNLDYNVVLISHEDTSKDLARRGGDKITSVKPNIQDKVANKLAGMVDVVARAVVIDGEHKITFKTDEVIFGGGRLKIERESVPMTYDDLASIYGGETTSERRSKSKRKSAEVVDSVPAETPETPSEEEENREEQVSEETPVEEVPRKRRGRPRKTQPTQEVEEAEETSQEVEEKPTEEARPRRTRKARN